MRLADRTAIVTGGGQTPGETMGNGRATALRFAQEGARVLVVDRSHDSAPETLDPIAGAGGQAVALRGDVTDEGDCQRIVERFGRVDILRNTGVVLPVDDGLSARVG